MERKDIGQEFCIYRKTPRVLRHFSLLSLLLPSSSSPLLRSFNAWHGVCARGHPSRHQVTSHTAFQVAFCFPDEYFLRNWACSVQTGPESLLLFSSSHLWLPDGGFWPFQDHKSDTDVVFGSRHCSVWTDYSANGLGHPQRLCWFVIWRTERASSREASTALHFRFSPWAQSICREYVHSWGF